KGRADHVPAPPPRRAAVLVPRRLVATRPNQAGSSPRSAAPAIRTTIRSPNRSSGSTRAKRSGDASRGGGGGGRVRDPRVGRVVQHAAPAGSHEFAPNTLNTQLPLSAAPPATSSANGVTVFCGILFETLRGGGSDETSHFYRLVQGGAGGGPRTPQQTLGGGGGGWVGAGGFFVLRGLSRRLCGCNCTGVLC